MELKKIAPIFLTMIILGCTQQTGVTVSGDGVTIQNFTSDFSSVFPNDRFTMTLSYKNNGGKAATNIFANLQAVSSLSVSGGTNRDSYKGSGLPPNDYDMFEWTLVVPENAIEGEVYHPKALFCYSYETDAYTDLFLAERTWNGELPALNTFYSSGPVSITFEKSVPIRGERSSSFKAIVTLVAPGFLGNQISSTDSYGTRDYLNELTLRIPAGKTQGNNWLVHIGNDDEIDFDCTKSNDEYICTASENALRAINDKADARLYLNIKPSNVGYDEGDSYEHTIRIYANAKYKHCMETDTFSAVSVVVKGY